jgi:hypothetical protein
LNLVLLATVAVAFRRLPAPAPSPMPVEPPLLAASAASTNYLGNNLYITNRFHWSQVESPNYERFVANLRAIGCPEKTIRDILIRDIEKAFALRMARSPEPANFWACGPEREKGEAVQRKQLAALRQEQRELIRHLLGIDYVKPTSDFNDLTGRAILLFVTGTMREGALDQVIDIFKLAEDARDEVQEVAGGLVTPAHEAELKRHRDQTLARLSAALSPAELEEFALRLAALKMMEGGSEDFKCTAAELRAMAAAYHRTMGLEGLNFELFNNEPEMPPQKQDELLAGMKAALGERRFEDFLRATDSDFNALSEFATDSRLPDNTALALFDVRRLAEREREQLLGDLSISGGARRERLQEIRHEALEAVRSQLGEAAYQEYARRGLTSWIEELGRP